MADKAAPLPASSGGLMRLFEDETKGFKMDQIGRASCRERV